MFNPGITAERFIELFDIDFRNFYFNPTNKSKAYVVNDLTINVFFTNTKLYQKSSKYRLNYQIYVYPNEEKVKDLVKDFFEIKSVGKRGKGFTSFEKKLKKIKWDLLFFDEKEVFLAYTGDRQHSVYLPFAKRRCILS